MSEFWMELMTLQQCASATPQQCVLLLQGVGPLKGALVYAEWKHKQTSTPEDPCC